MRNFLFALVCVHFLLTRFTATVYADLLDPLDFTSLGTLNLSGGNFTFDTDLLTIVDDVAPGTPLFTGVVDSQNGMASPGVVPEIAVFTFADIDLAISANITVSGTRSLALLSHSDIDIDTIIQLNGDGPGILCGGGCIAEAGGPGGFVGGLGFVAGTGPGGGGGSQGSGFSENFSGAGAGFGSMGQAGNGNPTAGAGGATYGNLVDTLQGGSGGGGGQNTLIPTILAGGGGGGGALEVGAIDTVTIGANGVLEANGGVGNETSIFSGLAWGGNGSGGGIRIHGASLDRLGAIRALGGTATPVGQQAAGGGGRVLVSGDELTFFLGNPISVSNATQGIDVSPGIAQGGAGALNHGAVTIAPELTIVSSDETFELGSIVVAQTASTTQPRVDLIHRSLQITRNGEVTVPTGGYTNEFELELRSTVAKITGTGADTLTNQSVLRGTGAVEVPVVNDAGGEINAVNDTLTFTQTVTSNLGAQINAINSTLNFNAGLTNNGEMNLINSNIVGSIASAATSSATLVGSNSVSGNYTIGAGDAVNIDLDGTLAGEFDTLSIGGDAILAGNLNIALDPGFTPSAGDTFAILTATNVISVFDTVNLPALPGDLLWYVNYGITSVELVSTYAADFDENGIVDGDDLTAWEAGFGSMPATHMTGDANADTAASGFDFLTWQQQFGNAGGGSFSAAMATPEPSSLLLAALGLFTLSVRRKRE